MKQKKQAIVIGAGVGGLATSIRLACAGWRVTVLEAAGRPGGKLQEFRQGGYRFDRGPSLFTLPENVEALFRLAGEEPADHFTYRRLDPVTRYHFPDGQVFSAAADEQAFIQEAAQAFAEPASHLQKQLAFSRFAYQKTKPHFLERSLHETRTWLNAKALGALLTSPKLKPFTSMNAANARRFRNPKLVQLFDRYATYNGSDPHQAPATLNVIPHLEFGIGAYAPVGGMYRITEALVGLAQRVGVKFRYNQAATRILRQEKHVTGVQTTQANYPAHVVVSNADVVTTYRKLLPDHPAPEKTLRQPRSSSALIFYWGMSRQFPELDVHNIFFSHDYRGEFQALFQEKTLHADPTVYVNIASKYSPTDAPAGHETWFVMVNAPHVAGQDWAALTEQARNRILGKLEQSLGHSVAPYIQTEAVWTPAGIEQDTGSYLGSLYGTSSNNALAAFLRHPNFTRQLAGLYFVGGSVHPGGGIPLCLFSARIATDRIVRDFAH